MGLWNQRSKTARCIDCVQLESCQDRNSRVPMLSRLRLVQALAALYWVKIVTGLIQRCDFVGRHRRHRSQPTSDRRHDPNLKVNKSLIMHVCGRWDAWCPYGGRCWIWYRVYDVKGWDHNTQLAWCHISLLSWCYIYCLPWFQWAWPARANLVCIRILYKSQPCTTVVIYKGFIYKPAQLKPSFNHRPY